jgi:tRNA (guanine37-N1)-methyltransferase
MHFVVLTIFPEMFESFWKHGIIRKAIDQLKITGSTINIRDYALDRHHVTDDRPYGGGSGMVMKPEPLAGAIRAAKKTAPFAKRILLAPRGRVFNQAVALELALQKGLILVCGRYEGVDERIGNGFIDDEISIGDYVLTGGELAAMVIVDAVTRMIPGTLGGEDSAQKDSFADGLLEHAHYTRPREFEGTSVPEVLLSGHHKEIEAWRLQSSLMRTFIGRRELLMKRDLSEEEKTILKGWQEDIKKILRGRSRELQNPKEKI